LARPARLPNSGSATTADANIAAAKVGSRFGSLLANCASRTVRRAVKAIARKYALYDLVVFQTSDAQNI
jgi:hypothetical protein